MISAPLWDGKILPKCHCAANERPLLVNLHEQMSTFSGLLQWNSKGENSEITSRLKTTFLLPQGDCSCDRIRCFPQRQTTLHEPSINGAVVRSRDVRDEPVGNAARAVMMGFIDSSAASSVPQVNPPNGEEGQSEDV